MQFVPRDLPAPTTAANVIRRLLMVAASQVGYREGRDADGDWNNDNAFGKWYGTNGVSWCAQFVSWAADSASIPTTVIPKHQYTPTGWNWFVAHDRDVTTPRAGDIFYVYGYVASEKQSRVHHVGIVEKVLDDGSIKTLEGNTNTSGSSQGNGVYRNTRPVTSKLRFARPNYAAAVQIVKPTPPTTKPPTPEPPAQEDHMFDAEETAQIAKAAGSGVHGQKIGRSDITIAQAIEETLVNSRQQKLQVAGLTAAVQALAEKQGVDAAAITAAVDAAVEAALDDIKITLTVDDGDEPTKEG